MLHALLWSAADPKLLFGIVNFNSVALSSHAVEKRYQLIGTYINNFFQDPLNPNKPSDLTLLYSRCDCWHNHKNFHSNFENIFWEGSRSQFLMPETRLDSRETFLRNFASKLNLKNSKNCFIKTVKIVSFWPWFWQRYERTWKTNNNMLYKQMNRWTLCIEWLKGV